MPLFRIGKDLHYFAHVPKCGGTSVEAYLAERFGPLGFLHPGHQDLPEHARWWRTSAQHVPAEAFFTLIPKPWIVSSFAVVRHPVSRLISAFAFSRNVQKLAPAGWTIGDYVAHWVHLRHREPFAFDGHLSTQSSFVPPEARVFRLEDGLDAIIPHVDALAGEASGRRTMLRLNVTVPDGSAQADAVEITPRTLALIGELYAEDLDRFGYDLGRVPDASR